MSLSLKHIPCPAGSKCTAFRCIFGHGNEEKQSHAKVIRIEAANPNGNDTRSPGPTHEPPLKRFKASAGQQGAKLEEQADESQSTSSASSGLDTPRNGEGAPHATSNVLKPTSRPISPPAVKRNGHSRNTSTSPRNDSTSSQVGQTVRPKKKESLNPRLLKTSPASHEVRLRLLRLLHKEFARLNDELKKDANDEEEKLLVPEQDLIIRALDEEELIAVEKAAVYPNIMKNKVMLYRRMTVAQWKADRAKETEAANKAQNGPDSSGEPQEINTGLTPDQEMWMVKRLLTPINELSQHGYVNEVPSDEAINKARDGAAAAQGWEKCDRCQQRFQVFPGRREEDGALTSGSCCRFHWGKAYVPAKPPGETARIPKRYRCCGEEVSESPGCFVHDHHVYKVTDSKRSAAVLNFAATPENSLPPADRAVCFDCEMAYTVHGMELVRLTATSWPTGETLLDVLVRPLGEVLDLNSRFSGVWPEDMASAKPWSADNEPQSSNGDETGSEDGEVKSSGRKLKIASSPEVARDLLFSLISPSTPLIGHGLENDLNAVRIVHPTLVDTVLLYPHKAGLPYRNGLKLLMDVHLNRMIQQETGPNIVGHDSAEDARAAGDLVRLKIMKKWQDMQRAGWKLVDGQFVGLGDALNGGGLLTEQFIES